jgi:molybdopterin/thiamine biosynthesis adenylyltransferase
MEAEDDLIIIPDTVGDRYASLGFMSWWRQEKVRAAAVMVVGAGALGNEVLKNLAMMGIGRLLIVDFDVVEPGNLSRSVLFRESDAGQKKAVVAARAVKALNPDVAVQALHLDVNSQLGMGVMRRMDGMVGCLDNREARLTLNRFSWQLGKPWVDGAIEALLGYARVFWPGQGACYECTLTDRDYELINLRRSCGLIALENLQAGKVPTTPTAAAIIGGIQSQEVLKIIHGMAVKPGVSQIINGLTGESYTTRLPIKHDCMSHARLDRIIEFPQATTEGTTLSDIYRLVCEKLGRKIHLYLHHGLVTELRCKRCQRVAPVLISQYDLNESLARCPVCKNMRLPTLINHYNGEPTSYAKEPLAGLGIPPLAVMLADIDDQTIGIELSGDAHKLMRFQ